MLLRDIHYALRLLWKRPGFTVIAVITLALGIGANTSIFSVVNAVLLAPLPYEEPERLVVLWESQVIANQNQMPVALANFEDWKEQNQVFEQLAASRNVALNLTHLGETERVTGARVSSNLYSLLRVKPFLGRAFSEAEGKPGAAPVALISHGLWQRRYGSDPQLVGRSLQIDGNAYTVIGVLPPGLSYPAADTDLVIPLVAQTREMARANHFVRVLGRLRPGVSLGEARAEMETISARLEQQYPDTNTGWRVQLVPLYEQLVGKARPALLILLGTVGCVLLIACANVANLLLARAAGRRMELAVRTALGASRWQLIRQLLTESILLSLFAGLCGILLASWGVPLLARLSSGTIPRVEEIGINYRVLGFTLLISLLTGVVFGILPALQSSSRKLTDSLREGRRGSTGGLLHKRVLNMLVISEVTLALVLLMGAGLMIRSFLSVSKVSPGFDPKGVLSLGIGISPIKYPELQQQAGFYQELLAKLETQPGLVSVAGVSRLPVVGGATTTFTIQGIPVASGHEPDADFRVVSPRYFQTMGIPFLKGRDFTTRDAKDAPDVVVINKVLAERFWPNEEPLGKHIQLSAEQTRWREIVGVVGNEKLSALDTEIAPAVYIPLPQNSFPNAIRSIFLVARAQGEPMALAQGIQNELRSMDKDQALFQVRPLEEVISNSLSQRRFNTLLLVIFAALAGLLAAIGIYGVMAYSVTQRTHEIGVRMALGAQSTDVLKMILGQGIRLTLIGVVAGLVAAFALTRVLSSLLYGVSATDPVTFLGIPLLLTAVALLASYLPARRATKVDPMIALRYD
ncbi:MAG TPA: ABC transporter permease [Pyrinomonadaceae bacterium]|jgi:putative ABC transport system permease protein|nr:ABC transporter permease [Pyrinomonadaceae bacterium]